MQGIKASGKRVDLIFKDFHANYKKRAEGDVHFICEEGEAVAALVEQALKTGERVEKKISAYAVVPSIDPKGVVAEFALTLSLKRRG
jgi:ribulose 1,5-bisphosphate synthetase/thiazole synthase